MWSCLVRQIVFVTHKSENSKCALLLWLVNCRAASPFDHHGLRTEAIWFHSWELQGYCFCRGFYTNTASRILQIISLLDGHFLWWFPSKLCNKYPFHLNHMFDFWQFALSSWDGIFCIRTFSTTCGKTSLLRFCFSED